MANGKESPTTNQVLNELRELWELMPHLRFGQLLSFVISLDDIKDPYYTENAKMISLILDAKCRAKQMKEVEDVVRKS